MERIVIEITPEFERAAIIEGKTVDALFIHKIKANSAIGDIFLGKVTDVHEGLQGAFVDIGFGKRGLVNKKDLLAYKTLESDARCSLNDVVFKGQEIIVQIKKTATKDKGPLLTQFISIVDDLFIYLPNSGYTAVSYKIPMAIKQTLQEQVSQYLQNPEGCIIRTAAQYVSFDKVITQLSHAREKWHHMIKSAQSMDRPGLLSKESGLVKQIIRDFSYEKIGEIVINNYEDYQLLLKYYHSHTGEKPTILYKEAANLFETIGIEEKLKQSMKKKVMLQNGSYILIEPTETLTVIDINTGTFKGGHSWEETAYTTNHFAVAEIARQLRVRQIGGIIIIDLIKMASEKQYKNVLEALKHALVKDRITTKVVGLTQLGLIEMTRKYSSMSLYDYFSEMGKRK